MKKKPIYRIIADNIVESIQKGSIAETPSFFVSPSEGGLVLQVRLPKNERRFLSPQS